MWLTMGFKIAWAFITGGGLTDILKPITAYLGKVSDNKAAVQVEETKGQVTVDVAALQAHTTEYLAAVDLNKYRWGWWGERYLLLAAALPPIIHSGAIYLDSTFKFGWAIAKAPGVYEGQELKIIASVCGYSIARAGVAALIGRSAGK